jgi:hypothetical protein
MKVLTLRISGFGDARSAGASGERSTQQCGGASSARKMQARQRCARVRVVHGSTNGDCTLYVSCSHRPNDHGREGCQVR